MADSTGRTAPTPKRRGAFGSLSGGGSFRAGAVGLLVLLFAGCSKTPKYEPGCYLNAAVKKETRQALETAAERFYANLRARHYEQAYAEAAGSLRNRVPKEQVAQAWTSIAEILTIPQDVETEELAVVVFPEGTRGPQEISCVEPADTSGARTMITTDQPFQAYLIQRAEVNGTTYNYASVWFHEEGSWKLATFGAKPGLLLGHDWKHYLELARSQRQKGNERNAALLYNTAMDLLVPAPWVRPKMLETLGQEQRQIRVSDLPAGRRLEWIAADGTPFRTYMVRYEPTDGGLGLVVEYEVPEPVDTTQVAMEAPKLASFVRSTFPEYPEIFSVMLLQATTPVKHEPVWAGSFPFQEP